MHSSWHRRGKELTISKYEMRVTSVVLTNSPERWLTSLVSRALYDFIEQNFTKNCVSNGNKGITDFGPLVIVFSVKTLTLVPHYRTIKNS